MRVIWAGACWILAATVGAGAVDLALDLAAVDEAVLLGQSRDERDRQRFHAAYRFAVDKAPLDLIDIVTPFRLIMLTAETRALVGERNFGQRRALEVLAAVGTRIDVQADFTFHPHNNFVGVPDYMIRLEGTPAVSGRLQAAPTAYERIPRFGARVEGAPLLLLPVPGGIAPGKSQPMLGGVVIAHFDGSELNPAGVYDVVVEEAGKEIGRVRVDFSKLR